MTENSPSPEVTDVATFFIDFVWQWIESQCESCVTMWRSLLVMNLQRFILNLLLLFALQSFIAKRSTLFIISCAAHIFILLVHSYCSHIVSFGIKGINGPRLLLHLVFWAFPVNTLFIMFETNYSCCVVVCYLCLCAYVDTLMKYYCIHLHGIHGTAFPIKAKPLKKWTVWVLIKWEVV